MNYIKIGPIRLYLPNGIDGDVLYNAIWIVAILGMLWIFAN